MKRKIILILILITLISLVACGKNSKVYPLEPDEDQRDIALSDMLGGQLRLEEAAQKLIVLSPGACEIISDLGASERIIARERLCLYPKEVAKLPIVFNQDLSNPALVEDLDSDLIIVDAEDISIENINGLYKAGLAVLILDVKNVEDIYRSTEIIAKALGKNLAAKELIQRMSKQWDRLRLAHEEKKGSIYIETSDFVPLSLAEDTLISYLLEEVGYKNVNASKESKALSLGEIKALDPDFVLILGEASQARREELSELRALKEDNLYFWEEYPRLAGSNFVSVLEDLIKDVK